MLKCQATQVRTENDQQVLWLMWDIFALTIQAMGKVIVAWVKMVIIATQILSVIILVSYYFHFNKIIKKCSIIMNVGIANQMNWLYSTYCWCIIILAYAYYNLCHVVFLLWDLFACDQCDSVSGNESQWPLWAVKLEWPYNK